MSANVDERIECSFLIPVTESKHRRMIPHVQSALLDAFGGYSMSEGLIQGAWKNDKGIRVNDTLRHFTVALHPAKVGDLRGILRVVCKQFEQDCVYFSVQGNVEFVAKIVPLICDRCNQACDVSNAPHYCPDDQTPVAERVVYDR
jgi:hypothetical protein